MGRETCSSCGAEIIFRSIRGVVVPIHPAGSGCQGASLYSRDAENCCHRVRCPRGCGAMIYFIRHNGSCAWFDHLGRPWDKHGCFEDESTLPLAWQAREGSEWFIAHLKLLGVIIGGGGAFLVGREPPRLRHWEARRCELFRALCLSQSTTPRMVRRLDGKTILLSPNRSRFFCADGHHWSLEEHHPSYRDRFPAETSLL